MSETSQKFCKNALNQTRGLDAHRGPGVVLEGEPYGLDGAMDGKAGIKAPAGGAQAYGWRVVDCRDHFGDFGCGGQLFCG